MQHTSEESKDAAAAAAEESTDEDHRIGQRDAYRSDDSDSDDDVSDRKNERDEPYSASPASSAQRSLQELRRRQQQQQEKLRAEEEEAAEDEILTLCALVEEFKDAAESAETQNEQLRKQLRGLQRERQQLLAQTSEQQVIIGRLEESVVQLVDENEQLAEVAALKDEDLERLQQCLNEIYRRKVEVDDQQHAEQGRVIEQLHSQTARMSAHHSVNRKIISEYEDIINDKDSEILDLKLLLRTLETEHEVQIQHAATVAAKCSNSKSDQLAASTAPEVVTALVASPSRGVGPFKKRVMPLSPSPPTHSPPASLSLAANTVSPRVLLRKKKDDPASEVKDEGQVHAATVAVSHSGPCRTPRLSGSTSSLPESPSAVELKLNGHSAATGAPPDSSSEDEEGGDIMGSPVVVKIKRSINSLHSSGVIDRRSSGPRSTARHHMKSSSGLIMTPQRPHGSGTRRVFESPRMLAAATARWKDAKRQGPQFELISTADGAAAAALSTLSYVSSASDIGTPSPGYRRRVPKKSLRSPAAMRRGSPLSSPVSDLSSASMSQSLSRNIREERISETRFSVENDRDAQYAEPRQPDTVEDGASAGSSRFSISTRDSKAVEGWSSSLSERELESALKQPFYRPTRGNGSPGPRSETDDGADADRSTISKRYASDSKSNDRITPRSSKLTDSGTEEKKFKGGVKKDYNSAIRLYKQKGDLGSGNWLEDDGDLPPALPAGVRPSSAISANGGSKRNYGRYLSKSAHRESNNHRNSSADSKSESSSHFDDTDRGLGLSAVYNKTVPGPLPSLVGTGHRHVSRSSDGNLRSDMADGAGKQSAHINIYNDNPIWRGYSGRHGASSRADPHTRKSDGRRKISSSSDKMGNGIIHWKSKRTSDHSQHVQDNFI